MAKSENKLCATHENSPQMDFFSAHIHFYASLKLKSQVAFVHFARPLLRISMWATWAIKSIERALANNNLSAISLKCCGHNATMPIEWDKFSCLMFSSTCEDCCSLAMTDRSDSKLELSKCVSATSYRFCLFVYECVSHYLSSLNVGI